MLLVTGATGNVGAELVGALAAGEEPVRALTHGKPILGLPPGVESVGGDLDRPASLGAALADVRAVFLLPGYEDMPGIMKEAHKAGVERIVLLSSSAAAAGDMGNAIAAYMIRSEVALRESPIASTILRPFGFMSNALRWLPQLRAGDLVREPFAAVRVAMIDPYDIAAVAASSLLSRGHDEQTYLLSGPQPLSAEDRVRILGKVLDRELRFEAESDAEARVRMGAVMPAEYVDASFNFYADGALDESKVQPTVERVLGRRPRSFEQWARAHVEALQ